MNEEAETLLTNLNGIGARCAPLYTFENYGPYHLVFFFSIETV